MVKTTNRQWMIFGIFVLLGMIIFMYCTYEQITSDEFKRVEVCGFYSCSFRYTQSGAGIMIGLVAWFIFIFVGAFVSKVWK